MYDIIIVGGGPAGISAGIYACRAGKSTLVIERGALGGQMTYSPKIENYPAKLSVSGNELAEAMTDQLIQLGGEFEFDEVTRIENNGEYKTVFTHDNEFSARAVILANGVKHRMLGLEGEEELVGSGISFCAVCDGAFYRDRDVAVIGGGNSAMQEALLLSEGCRSVTVVQNLSGFTGERKLAESLETKKNVSALFDTVVEGFVTSGGNLKGIEVKNTATGDKRTVVCSGVFVAIGLVPENGAFEALVPLDARGYYASGEDCTTPTPGIFVAGDCRAKKIRQITTAVADGAVAALAACAYIDDK